MTTTNSISTITGTTNLEAQIQALEAKKDKLQVDLHTCTFARNASVFLTVFGVGVGAAAIGLVARGAEAAVGYSLGFFSVLGQFMGIPRYGREVENISIIKDKIKEIDTQLADLAEYSLE